MERSHFQVELWARRDGKKWKSSGKPLRNLIYRVSEPAALRFCGNLRRLCKDPVDCSGINVSERGRHINDRPRDPNRSYLMRFGSDEDGRRSFTGAPWKPSVRACIV
ncbi:hypothetical protein GWI33_006793 [Rhynchophorus ferrugineus]|uniref:Uncharacterized protein n=1 Tax=Rhynchophorus ferrugineus TaxID=354439 RepID=A0A834MIR3_RHYFE|nr:hypothetical protein GWI33_006793 [Rhynchophorus ferrugineus]